jgi:hypothetical protein
MFARNTASTLTRRADGENNRKHNQMKTYQETLDAVIRYIAKNGKTQETINKVEAMLPGVWAAELIADALDALA